MKTDHGSAYLKKGEGASLKTPALAGEKSATQTLYLLNNEITVVIVTASALKTNPKSRL
jgi:hypothetical protein